MKEHTMSNRFRIIAAGALLAIGLASASAVYAEQSPSADRSETGVQHHGMMGTQGGMMGMGGRREKMGQMMESGNNRMKSQNQAPNSQSHNPSHPSPKEGELRHDHRARLLRSVHQVLRQVPRPLPLRGL